ncbi:MAG: sulfur carrier protein ThiS [Proteobacteria bacterium]|jgi:thiamine biosynthesis protein ThiS|nr:sulfur carrier protein ThiS [Pseudomonadota bacterium]
MPLLTINSETKEIVSVGIEELLAELSLPAPLMLVEHNGKALHRSEWKLVTLSDGDRLELMKVAAGG